MTERLSDSVVVVGVVVSLAVVVLAVLVENVVGVVV